MPDREEERDRAHHHFACTYTVTATRVATKESVSQDSRVWGANSSVRRIALITCDDDGGYRADGHRVSNFVVIAEAR
ncbi:hypothetical protein BCF74_10985 [Knoellia remsis]|uniref:Sortase family protein n=1 Tax=Knoellia remsis TaxID=407159 RepID=A0A2T0UNI9_9MICO|nr:hypothetical protein BCF74_10985 [Knoellia remsis]